MLDVVELHKIYLFISCYLGASLYTVIKTEK